MNKNDRMVSGESLLENNPELKLFFFPSLFNEDVFQEEIDKQYERIKILNTDDALLLIKKTINSIDQVNKIVKSILKKNQHKLNLNNKK